MKYPNSRRIVDFIKENKILTICCTDQNNKPYCFHCFYAFDEENYLLFFKSSTDSFHTALLAQNPVIAGSILPEKIELMALKGIQLTGTVLYNDFPCHNSPENIYHKKFPFAVVKPGHVWCIQVEALKMTDNTNVFGKKLEWHKEELV
jgi:uncharacterized protein YhbP (UPF0306 family)